MKLKILLIIVILIFVSSWTACDRLNEFRAGIGSGGKESVAVNRGIDAVFRYSENQPPDEIRIGKDFKIGVNVINYGDKDVDVGVELRDNLDKEYGEVEDSGSLFLNGMFVENEELVKTRNEGRVSFGPFKYNGEILKNEYAWFDAKLSVDKYEVEGAAELCVKKDGVLFGCTKPSSLTNFGFSNSRAPVSISKIEVFESQQEDTDKVDVKLKLFFKKYGGSIKEMNEEVERINDFSIGLIEGQSFKCGSYYSGEEELVLNKKGEYVMLCETSIELREDEAKVYRLEFSFDYPYEISKQSRKIKII